MLMRRRILIIWTFHSKLQSSQSPVESTFPFHSTRKLPMSLKTEAWAKPAGPGNSTIAFHRFSTHSISMAELTLREKAMHYESNELCFFSLCLSLKWALHSIKHPPFQARRTFPRWQGRLGCRQPTTWPRVHVMWGKCACGSGQPWWSSAWSQFTRILLLRCRS